MISEFAAANTSLGDNSLAGAHALQSVLAAGPHAPMMPLMRHLWPICRSLTGPGVRESLDIIEGQLPLERYATPSGQAVFDWRVPPEWRIRDAYIADESGARIVDFRENNLHVVQYSEPVDTVLDLAELQARLNSIPAQPDAIPYLSSYYRRSWGFCMTERQRQALKPGKYRCVIDSEFKSDGQLDFAQCVVRGASPDEIFFSTYLCHPSMANNELSGPVVQTKLFEILSRITGLRLSYRAAFTTETIGTLCYLERFGKSLKRSMQGGCVISCVGDPGPFTFVKSRIGNSISDQIFAHALAHKASSKKVSLRDWHPNGSDERQYCSPAFNFPMGSFSRSRFAEFPEYHTSLDNLEFVKECALQESLEFLVRVCQAFELSLYPIRVNPYGEPQLGKRGLYQSDRTSLDIPTTDRMFILAYADGLHSMLQIAELSNRPIWELLDPLQSLIDANLITLSAKPRLDVPTDESGSAVN